MSKAMGPQPERLAEMRNAFDRTFQSPYRLKAKDAEAMIAFRAAGVALAARVQDVTGVMKRTVILSIPSKVPGSLGVAVVRGGLIPVFNLAALLGLPLSGEPQWFLLTNRQAPVALAFDGLEGRVEVERSRVYADQTSSSHKHLHQLAEIGELVRAVIDVPGLMAKIGQCAGLIAPAKE